MTLVYIMAPHFHGYSSSKRMILAGVVKVNGKVVSDPEATVSLGDIITVGKHKRMVVQ